MTDKPSTFVGLDMGSALTRCVVAVQSGKHLAYLSCGVMPPARWDASPEAARAATAESVYEVVREAEEGAGASIISAIVGVASDSVSSHLVHTGVTLPADVGKIRPCDVPGVIEKAEQGLVQRETTALQLVPLEFIAGPCSGLRDPIGYPARRLEAFVRVIAIRRRDHDSVRALVNGAGIRVQDTILDGYAAAFGTLTQPEINAGVAHLEFGRTSTSLTVYCRGCLRLAIGLPIGRDDLVDDLARTLKTSSVVASSLITDFGRIEFDLGQVGAMIFVPGTNPVDPVGSGSMRSCRLVNGIITRRVNDCLQMAHEEIRGLAMRGEDIRSLVLSGDMAALPGIRERARDLLRLNVRIGLPSKLQGMPPALQHPGWACAVGAVLYAHRLAYGHAGNTNQQEAFASGGLRQGERVS